MKSKSEITGTGASNAEGKLSLDIIHHIKDLTHKWAAIVVFLVLWEVLSLVGILNTIYIPSPITIAEATWSLIFDPSSDFILNTMISLSRVFIGLGAAIAVAIPLGFLLGGYFKGLEVFLDPLIMVLGQINPWSFLHIIIILVGFGQYSIIASIFYIALWPVLYNTITGIKNIDPIYFRIGKAAAMSDFDIFWKVQLPASMPMIFAGLRLAAILSFFMVVGAEMMGADDGLGYKVMFYEMYTMLPEMWACIVTMSLAGIIFVFLLLQMEKYFVDWKEDVLPYNPGW